MSSKRKILLYMALIAVLLLLAGFVYYYRVKLGKIMTPFLMALVIAYLLNPLVKRLEERKIPCTISIMVIYLGFTALLAILLIFIVPEVVNNTRDLMTTLPEITSRYQGFFNRMVSLIQSSNWSQDIKNAIFNEIQNGTMIAQEYMADFLKRALAGLLQTASMFVDFILAMIIAYYFIKDAKFFREAVLSLVPRRWRNGLVNTGRDINSVLSNFIQGQLLTALIVGVLEAMGLLIAGVKYPLILGMVGGLANIIPYFGPIIGAVPAVAVALMDSPMRALWTVLVFVIVQQIDNAFISPKIIESRLGLHPVTTILAVLIGQEFFGILGMLISVPIMAILKVIVKRIVEAIV